MFTLKKLKLETVKKRTMNLAERLWEEEESESITLVLHLCCIFVAHLCLFVCLFLRVHVCVFCIFKVSN